MNYQLFLTCHSIWNYFCSVSSPVVKETLFQPRPLSTWVLNNTTFIFSVSKWPRKTVTNRQTFSYLYISRDYNFLFDLFYLNDPHMRTFPFSWFGCNLNRQTGQVKEPHTINDMWEFGFQTDTETDTDEGLFTLSIGCLIVLSYIESLITAYLFIRKHVSKECYGFKMSGSMRPNYLYISSVFDSNHASDKLVHFF